MYAFKPSGEKARLAGPEPTKTVASTASVFVLMIATEFWDGIVAYISGAVGLITSDEDGKEYCARICPKAGVPVGVDVAVAVAVGVGVGVGDEETLNTRVPVKPENESM